MNKALGIGFYLSIILTTSVVANDEGFVPLYNGKDLSGWRVVGGRLESWKADGEIIACVAPGGGWLITEKEYADFILKVDWRIPPGGNSGVGLRFPGTGRLSAEGMEIQILDDNSPRYKNLKPAQYTGSIYYQVAPQKKVPVKPNEWHSFEILCQGALVVVKLDTDNDIKDLQCRRSSSVLVLSVGRYRRRRCHGTQDDAA